MPEYFTRPPRIQPELPAGEVQIPAPPNLQGDRTSLIQLALPLITVVGYVLVSGAQSGGASSLLFVLPMAMSIIASTSLAFVNYRRTRRIDGETQAAYAQRLGQMR